ncbi:hypothetical protein HK102_013058, partial [Quaeritorhiza haematococci]
KQLNVLISGWLDIILDYSFEVRHRPGILNILPDALSRIQYTYRETVPQTKEPPPTTTSRQHQRTEPTSTSDTNNNNHKTSA